APGCTHDFGAFEEEGDAAPAGDASPDGSSNRDAAPPVVPVDASSDADAGDSGPCAAATTYVNTATTCKAPCTQTFTTCFNNCQTNSCKKNCTDDRDVCVGKCTA